MMKVSDMTRLLHVVLVGVCTGSVGAEGVDSKRSAAPRVLETNVSEDVAQDAEMVADGRAQRDAEPSVVRVERTPSNRAVMEGEVLHAITFWDDVNRYDLVLDPDGAILVDVEAQTVSDSFAFKVGPVPIVKNPNEVHVASLRSMARRRGDSGVFDMEIGNLTAETAMDAVDRSEAASVFVNSGTVVALFYVNGEVAEVLHFAPTPGEGGAIASADVSNEEQKKAICAVLYEACVQPVFNFDACMNWAFYCQTSSTTQVR